MGCCPRCQAPHPLLVNFVENNCTSVLINYFYEKKHFYDACLSVDCVRCFCADRQGDRSGNRCADRRALRIRFCLSSSTKRNRGEEFEPGGFADCLWHEDRTFPRFVSFLWKILLTSRINYYWLWKEYSNLPFSASRQSLHSHRAQRTRTFPHRRI